VLQVEKAHLEEDRERLRAEVDRLRRELADEREKREDERSEFMALLRQKEETVQLLTDQTNRVKRHWWQRSKGASA
jgi:predicted nuclease with TOPRIM domain